MTRPDNGLYGALLRRGVSRRAFLGFCAAMAGTLALPATYANRIAAAVESAPRLPLIWLRGQGCGADTQALFQASEPGVAELFLELLSVDHLDTLMAASGADAEAARTETMEAFPNGYIAVVEGAVPGAQAGAYCMTGGRPFSDVVREVADGSLLTIAVGSCAFDGGLSGAAGGRTGAAGVGAVIGTSRLTNLPGCPVNVANLTATIVHVLTFREPPAADMRGRPLFAYGGLIHNQCERRAHFEFGEFVLAWGDEAAQKGWCLYKMGCKGPETFANCASVRYAEGTSWPVKAGHGCIGCTMPGFWDAMSPFYQRLPGPLPFAPDVSVDQVGLAVVGGVGAMTLAHGAASVVRQKRAGHGEHADHLAPTEPEPAAPLVAVPTAGSVVPPAWTEPVDEPAPGRIATGTPEVASRAPEEDPGVEADPGSAAEPAAASRLAPPDEAGR
ncbi:MAG TPA: hydrogenase small subunit [Candidatus Limnocylindrales bacterium]